jgi:hypothetical protein
MQQKQEQDLEHAGKGNAVNTAGAIRKKSVALAVAAVV